MTPLDWSIYRRSWLPDGVSGSWEVRDPQGVRVSYADTATEAGTILEARRGGMSVREAHVAMAKASTGR